MPIKDGFWVVGANEDSPCGKPVGVLANPFNRLKMLLIGGLFLGSWLKRPTGSKGLSIMPRSELAELSLSGRKEGGVLL